MEIKRIRVCGFEPALHGMRNPMDSWADSDSAFYERGQMAGSSGRYDGPYGDFIRAPEYPVIGPKDMELAKKLIMRGREHRKFLRQIMIWFDINIPRFVWQELDTYKVSTVRNSCSTMNTLGKRDLDQSAFERPIPELTLEGVNKLGRLLREAKEDGEGVREARVQLKNDLPEGFLQMATYMLSYETALTAILQRERHRLPQWRKGEEGSIVECLLCLPYMSHFYEAATFKRRQLRRAIKDLKEMIRDVQEGMSVEVDQLQDMLKLLKEAS